MATMVTSRAKRIIFPASVGIRRKESKITRRAITSDLYGALVDTTPFSRELEAIAHENGADPRTVVDTYLTNEARVSYAKPFRVLDDQIAETPKRCDVAMATSFMTGQFDRLWEVQKRFPAWPDTVPALRDLKEHGYELHVMSNSCHQIIESHMAELDNLIDDYLLADDVKAYKPQHPFFSSAEEKFNPKGPGTFHCHVAQGCFWDIIPACHFGWNKIWINRFGERGLDDQRPYGELPTLEHIREELEKLQ